MTYLKVRSNPDKIRRVLCFARVVLFDIISARAKGRPVHTCSYQPPPPSSVRSFPRPKLTHVGEDAEKRRGGRGVERDLRFKIHTLHPSPRQALTNGYQDLHPSRIAHPSNPLLILLDLSPQLHLTFPPFLLRLTGLVGSPK